MKSLLVFMASFLAGQLFLILERQIGIDWDFHPDAVTYVQDFAIYTESINDVFNNLYFFISKAFSGNALWLIELNICVYALSNVVGYQSIMHAQHRGLIEKRQARWLLAIFWLQPYRLHLAVHVLKDTLVIFLLLLTLVQSKGWRMWSFPLLVLMRAASVLYFTAWLPRKIIVLLLLCAGLFLMLPDNDLLFFLLSRNEIDMGGRDFNTVTAFTEFGSLAALLRFLIWPFLLLTGSFIIFSPTFFFVPIALEMLVGRYAQWRWARFPFLGLAMFVALGITAMIINSFTAYVRYAYPLICLMPFFSLHSKNSES